MNTSEDIAWAAISEMKGVGPKTMWRLADYLESEHKSAVWLLDNPDILGERLGSRCSESEIYGAIDRARNELPVSADENISIVHPLHTLFPSRLRLLSDEFALPAIFYARGNLDLLAQPGIAVVGARNAGESAIAVTENLVGKIAGKEINIVSGYAKGIDSTAHLASLNSGGTTTIVISEGINNFSAKGEFKHLITLDNTLIISQFEPDARWSAHFAMTRNKLICAMSSAVLVITSGPERDNEGRMSGTFDTGITALKMNLPTFVITPSYFDDPPSGNQELIGRGGIEFDPSQDIEIILNAISPVSQSSAPITGVSKKNSRKSRKTEQIEQLDFFTERK